LTNNLRGKKTQTGKTVLQKLHMVKRVMHHVEEYKLDVSDSNMMSSSSDHKEQVTEDLSQGYKKKQRKRREKVLKRRRGLRLTGVSKQRKNANARERNRVNILNNYIQLLQTLIPESGKRVTKFDVIIGAATYISELTSILREEKKTDGMKAEEMDELSC